MDKGSGRVVVRLVYHKVGEDGGVGNLTSREPGLRVVDIHGHVERSPSSSLIEGDVVLSLLNRHLFGGGVDDDLQNLRLTLYLPPRKQREVDVERHVGLDPHVDDRRHGVVDGVVALVLGDRRTEGVERGARDGPALAQGSGRRCREHQSGQNEAGKSSGSRISRGPLAASCSSHLALNSRPALGRATSR